MKRCLVLAFVALGISLAATLDARADIIVPNGFGATDGDGTFSLTSTSTQRTYQMTIDASQLSSVVGHNLLGIQWRLNGSLTAPAWPSVDTNYSFFDVFIGPSVDPSAMSNTFALNYTSAATQVRSGAFTFNANSFSNGNIPNPFGSALLFNSPYLYTGGDLAVEFRFSTQSGATNQPSFDAMLASGGPGNGWGVNFNARWTSNPAGGVGGNANFLVTNILSAQAIPEPASCAVAGIAVAGLLFRRRRK